MGREKPGSRPLQSLRLPLRAPEGARGKEAADTRAPCRCPRARWPPLPDQDCWPGLVLRSPSKSGRCHRVKALPWKKIALQESHLEIKFYFLKEKLLDFLTCSIK